MIGFGLEERVCVYCHFIKSEYK